MTSNEKEEESMSAMMSSLKTPTGEEDYDDESSHSTTTMITRRRGRTTVTQLEGQPLSVRQKTSDARENRRRSSAPYNGSGSEAACASEEFEPCLPFDTKGAEMYDRMSDVSLEVLRSEDARQNNVKYIDLQLLRIISPANIAGSNTAYTYGNRNRNRNTGNQTNYTRLFLVRVYSQNESNRLCYLMEGRTENKRLWKYNCELRDNGVITIGTVFRLLAPRPIENVMVGDIPLLVSKFPARVLKDPSRFVSIGINLQTQGNESFAFVANNANITIDGFTPVPTSCSGLFCDRQRVDDWYGTDRGCGCYSMTHRRSSIGFQHDVTSTLNSGDTISMSGFSSAKFSKLYLSANFSPNTNVDQLEFTSEFFEIMNHLEQVVDYIHDNGGFTIIGWYKRGVINDRSLCQNNTSAGNNNSSSNNESIEVDNGQANFHITQIFPTNRDFTDPTTLLGETLASLKFDVRKIH